MDKIIIKNLEIQSLVLGLEIERICKFYHSSGQKWKVSEYGIDYKSKMIYLLERAEDFEIFIKELESALELFNGS